MKERDDGMMRGWDDKRMGKAVFARGLCLLILFTHRSHPGTLF